MKKIYRLEDLDCANCAAKIETAIRKLEGVTQVSVSFMAQKLTIEAADGVSMDELMHKVAQVCKRVEPDCRIIGL